ncbi:hypothetical protein [Cellulosimicrobium sp. 22601]|uniref:hypothetical protein n=1 Tax=unclassified Cellulosimicrobium TaxID=2624466 RepID=UPI003F864E51
MMTTAPPASCTAHAWTATTAHDDGRPVFACTACAETTTGCQDCDRPLETALTICARCLDRARGLLDDIGTYLAEMSDVARVAVGLRAVRYDLTGTASASSSDRLPHGLDAAYREDVPVPGPSSIRTRGGALDLLEAWVDDWVDRCGDPDGAWDTLTYLASHTLWAAQNHPAWRVYLDELRATRAVVRRLAGLAPERVGSCPDCGGPVVRDWDVAAGLGDDARCSRCGKAWLGGEHLALDQGARLRELPDTDPDLLVTIDQARRLVPEVKRNTINQVLARDRKRPAEEQRLPVRGHDAADRALYRLGDVRDLARDRAPA